MISRCKSFTLLIFLFLVAHSIALECNDFKSCSKCLARNDTCFWCQETLNCKELNEQCAKKHLDSCPAFFNWQLIVSTIVIFFSAAVAAGVGIGGGALFVPIMSVFLQISPTIAVPLSKITILGVAIGGLVILLRKRHPKANRPLIDFHIALLMGPLTLVGTIIGVWFNVIFPVYVLVIFLVLILSATVYKTYVKGFELLKKEKQSALSKTEEPKPTTDKIELKELPEDAEKLPEDAEKLPGEVVPLEDVSKQEDQDKVVANNEALQKILEAESKIPYLKILSLIALEIGMLVLILLRGGEGKSVVNVTCNSAVYWVIVAVTFIYLFVFVFFVTRILDREHKGKQQAGYEYLNEDLKWTKKTIVVFVFMSILVGICAGFLGVGGGLLAGPILLEMGVMPAVSAATSSFLILFTSSSTTAQFIIFGKLHWTWGIWYFFVGLGAAILGQYVVAKIIQKYKKQAFISLLLATLILLSLLTLTIEQSIQIANNVKGHIPMPLKSICSPHG